MKQVSYDFSWGDILSQIIESAKPEDGQWRLEVITESATTYLPQLFIEQADGNLPGHVVRIKGFKLIKVDGSFNIYDTTVSVKDGQIVQQPIQGELLDGADTSGNGPQQVSSMSE